VKQSATTRWNQTSTAANFAARAVENRTIQQLAQSRLAVAVSVDAIRSNLFERAGLHIARPGRRALGYIGELKTRGEVEPARMGSRERFPTGMRAVVSTLVLFTD
jgi:hypothetical protein